MLSLLALPRQIAVYLRDFRSSRWPASFIVSIFTHGPSLNLRPRPWLKWSSVRKVGRPAAGSLPTPPLHSLSASSATSRSSEPALDFAFNITFETVPAVDGSSGRLVQPTQTVTFRGHERINSYVNRFREHDDRFTTGW